MKSVFLKRGGSFYASDEETIELCDILPPAVYTVAFDMDSHQCYLEPSKAFDLPEKFYGDVQERADRVIRSFEDRTTSTGIILSGEKGSGKTLLAKIISNKLLEKEVITIMVNQSHKGDSFNKLIQTLNQPAFIFFDEYEKTYKKEEDQNSLLSVFDGLYTQKKLFAITCNDRTLLSPFLLNRPGRFLYSFEYEGLDEEFVKDYTNDNLKNKVHIPEVLKFVDKFDSFSFDMLQALIEEMNRYDETVEQAAQYINISLESMAYGSYTVVEFTHKKEKVTSFNKNYYNGYAMDPFLSSGYVSYTSPKNVGMTPSEDRTTSAAFYDDYDEDTDHNLSVKFDPRDVVGPGPNGSLILENDKARAIIAKTKRTKYKVF